MAKVDRDLRKFEPGTKQEERFNLVKQAMISHRERAKSDVSTVQLLSPQPVKSAKASVQTRLKSYIDSQNKKLEGLPYTEKVKFLFPKPTTKRKRSGLTRTLDNNAKMYAKAASAGLASTPTEFWTKVQASGLSAEDWVKSNQIASSVISEPVRYVFERGGATTEEMAAKRISPKRMGEILTNFFNRENIDVVSGEDKLAASIQKATGVTAEEALASASKYVGARPEDRLAWVAERGSPIRERPLVYMRSREELKALGTADPNRFIMSIASHEATEVSLLKKEGTPWFQKLLKDAPSKPRVGHVSPEIYKADIEIASMLGPESVRDIVSHRAKELPRVAQALQELPDSDLKSKALKSIQQLPTDVGDILKRRGYSSQEIDSHVSAVRQAVKSGFSPSPELGKVGTQSSLQENYIIKDGKYQSTKDVSFKQVSTQSAVQVPSSSSRSSFVPSTDERGTFYFGPKVKSKRPEIQPGDIEIRWSEATGTSGRSKWSEWQHAESDWKMHPKSAFFKLKGPTKEIRKKFIDYYGYDEARRHLPKTEWLEFKLDFEDISAQLDLRTREGREQLSHLELNVAKRLGDEEAAEILTERIKLARPAKQVRRKPEGTENNPLPPNSAAHKNARRTIEQTVAKKTQKVAEFKLPPVLEDYVSQGVKDAQRASQMGPLRRVAPYAAGVLIGADVLSSRDKTGPTWGLAGGGIAAGLAWVLTRGKVARGTTLLAGAAGYGAGRLAGGAMAASHSGSLEGFGERGFAPAMRQSHSAFGSGWQGLAASAKAILKTDAGKALGGAIGLGVAIGVGTGDFGTGYNAATSAVGGAAIGYLKGGMGGAMIGMVGGAVGGTAINKTVEKFGGTVGEAFVGGVTTSVAASLAMAGMLRGGLFYKSIRAGMKGMGASTEVFAKAFKAQGMKDPLGPTGLAVNPSDMFRSLSANASELGIGPSVQKALSKVSGYLDKSPRAKKYFDAAFGSPKLIEAAEKVGGAENITTSGFAKAIGQDILEGLPVGLATSAVSLPFALLGGKGSSRDVSHNPSIGGFAERGEASIGRKQLTEFGSGWTGVKKVIKGAANKLSQMFDFVDNLPQQSRLITGGPAPIPKPIWTPSGPIKQMPTSKELGLKGNIRGEFSIYDVRKQMLEIGREKGVNVGYVGPLEPRLPTSKELGITGSLAGEFSIADVRKEMDKIRKEKHVRKLSNTPAEFSIADVQKLINQEKARKGIVDVGSSKAVQKSPIRVVSPYKQTKLGDVSWDEFGDPDISSLLKNSVDPLAKTLSPDIGSAATIMQTDPIDSLARTLAPDFGRAPTVMQAKPVRKINSPLDGAPSPLKKKVVRGLPSKVKSRNQNVRLDDINWDEFDTPGDSIFVDHSTPARKASSKHGNNPRSVNEAIQTSSSPSPVFQKSVNPFVGTLVKGAVGTIAIGSSVALASAVVDKTTEKYKRDYSDFAYSSPHGARMRQHKPKVLESFIKTGMAGAIRKPNTGGDFGTGWDPLRKIAASLLGKASKEGAETALRGAKYKEFLRSDDFQKALKAGAPVKGGDLGQGGFGAVQLMETTLPDGSKFRFARKSYTAPDYLDPLSYEGSEYARKVMEGESQGLRAMQGTIAPTVYGKGRLSLSQASKMGDSATEHVLYMEVVEGAQDAGKVLAKQGGATKAQADQLTRAIKDLHEKNLYHSDVRPSNMLVDKEGRLVLIDPMPTRYSSMGLGDVSNRIGKSQDIEALEMFRHGPPEVFGGNLSQGMTALSNSLFLTMREMKSSGGIVQMMGPKAKAKLKMVQSYFRRAGADSVADIFGIPMPPKSPVSRAPSVGSAKEISSARSGRPVSSSPVAAKSEVMKTGAASPLAKARATPRPAENAFPSKTIEDPTRVDSPSAIANQLGENRALVNDKNRKRESLHNAVMNFIGGLKQGGHRNMAQSGSQVANMDLPIHSRSLRD